MGSLRALPVLVLLPFVFTITPRAAADEERGFSIGARVGWGIPEGKIASGQDLPKVVSGIAPLAIDAGYRFDRDLYLGLYFQFAYAFLSSDYPACANASCSGIDLRYGVDFRWYFTHVPQGTFVGLDPWLGLGAGREDARLSAGNDTLTAGGWEFLKIELGNHFITSKDVRIGPVFGLTFSEYTAESLNGSSVDVASRPHYWVFVGFSGRYDL